MGDVIEKLYGFSIIWFKVNHQGSWSTTWNKVKVTGDGHSRHILKDDSFSASQEIPITLWTGQFIALFTFVPITSHKIQIT
jgi:hypothetical protein